MAGNGSNQTSIGQIAQLARSPGVSYNPLGAGMYGNYLPSSVMQPGFGDPTQQQSLDPTSGMTRLDPTEDVASQYQQAQSGATAVGYQPPSQPNFQSSYDQYKKQLQWGGGM